MRQTTVVCDLQSLSHEVISRHHTSQQNNVNGTVIRARARAKIAALWQQ
jgi:hypothetical protein